MKRRKPNKWRKSVYNRDEPKPIIVLSPTQKAVLEALKGLAYDIVAFKGG